MRWERCIGQKSVRTSTRRFEQNGVHIVLSFISWIKTTHSIWFGMILCMITTCPFLCRSWSLLIKFSRLELQPTSIHPKTGRRLPACDPIAPQSWHPKICLSYLSHTSPFVLGCIGFGAVHGQVPSSGKLPGPGSSRQQFWLGNDELAELELNSTPGSMIPGCFPQPGRQFESFGLCQVGNCWMKSSHVSQKIFEKSKETSIEEKLDHTLAQKVLS